MNSLKLDVHIPAIAPTSVHDVLADNVFLQGGTTPRTSSQPAPVRVPMKSCPKAQL